MGDNETLSNLTAVQLPEKVLSVSAGSQATCALLESGGMTCWGSATKHGRATSTIGDNETPFAFAALALGGSVNQIETSGNISCALLSGGSVKCWGFGAYGELGLGDPSILTQYIAASATSISFNGQAIQMSGGDNFSCILLDNGEVQCWGRNQYGQLGLGHFQTIGDNESPTERTVIEGTGIDPIARFTPKQILSLTGQAISFDASDSYTSSSISTYSWDFGDESTTQTGQTVNHTFSTAGAYDVTLTVTDSNTQTHSVSKKLTILTAETEDEDEDEESTTTEGDSSGGMDP